MKFRPHTDIVASSAGNSIGAFPGQNKRADMSERSEARVEGLRTREKMKRVACRFWTTYSCTAHSVRALAIMYDRGRVIKFCRTTVSVG